MLEHAGYLESVLKLKKINEESQDAIDDILNVADKIHDTDLAMKAIQITIDSLSDMTNKLKELKDDAVK